MSELDYDFIFTKYWLEEPGWSLRDLAKHYNTYQAKIIRFFRKNDIPTRTMSEGCKESWKCLSHYENRMKVFRSPEFKTKMRKLISNFKGKES